MSSRIQKVRKKMIAGNGHALLITHPRNIFYLSGFIGISDTERESCLLLTKEDALLFVPAMYETQARVAQAVKEGEVRVVVDRERDGLLLLFHTFVSEGMNVLYESHDLKVGEFEKMKNATHAILLPVENFIEEFRIVKSEEEIDCIRRAVLITELAFNAILEFLSTADCSQLTEWDVSDRLQKLSRTFGGEGWGFEPIVASGADTAIPHHVTSNKHLQSHAPLLLDFGIKYHGYTADMTRTIHLGRASERFKEIYALVLESNRRAIQFCSPGVRAGDVYDVSNKRFKEKNLAPYFIHGLGHGVGLQVHEAPYLRFQNDTILKEGMISSIEPGLYFPGEFGVRIEDLVLLTPGGCELLTSRGSKELIEIF